MVSTRTAVNMSEVASVAGLLEAALSSFTQALEAYKRGSKPRVLYLAKKENREDLERSRARIQHLESRYLMAMERLLLLVAVESSENWIPRKGHAGDSKDAEVRLECNLPEANRAGYLDLVSGMREAMVRLRYQLDLEHPSFGLDTQDFITTQLIKRGSWRRRTSTIGLQVTTSHVPCVTTNNTLPYYFGDPLDTLNNCIVGLDLIAHDLTITSAPQANCEGDDFDLIGDLFPNLRLPRSSWLRARLSKANDVRRRYLHYHHGHRSRLFSSALPPNAEATKHDHLAQAEPTGDSPISYSSPYGWTPGLRPHLVTAQNLADSLVVPDLAHLGGLSPKFCCHLCGNHEMFKSQTEWAEHVFSDLRAYVCLNKNCDLLMFESREAWLKHESSQHDDHYDRRYSAGSADQQESPSHTPSDLVDPNWRTSCHFCHWKPDQVWDPPTVTKMYIEHAGEHLEKIALITVTAPYSSNTTQYESQFDLQSLLLSQGLEKTQRYRMALAIATSHVMKDTSNWLSMAWSDRNVVFIEVDGVLRTDYPLLKRNDEQAMEQANAERTRSSTIDNSLVSLGITLLELYFGRTLSASGIGEKFSKSENQDSSSNDWAAAMLWVDKVVDQDDSLAVPYYVDAVRYCLRKRVDKKQNPGWREELHKSVIIPLRSSYETVCRHADATP